MKHYSIDDLGRLRKQGVMVEIPDWLFGNSPAEAREFAGWDLQTEKTPWSVRNKESKDGTRPDLVKVSRVGTSIDPSNIDAYRRLENLAGYDSFSSEDSWARVTALHEKIANEFPDELAARLTSFRALIMGAPNAAALPALAAMIMGEWFDTESAPNASLHLVEVSSRLGNRYGMTRALLQRQKPASAEAGFASSLGLMQDISLGLSGYLEPLVTSLSPRVWGVTAPRAGGVVLLSLGLPVRGRPVLSTVIGLSNRSSATEDIKWDPLIPADAFRETINWWISRLDLVFSHLTEPSNYEVGGFYDAPSALERLLNFEQICRSCQSIATVTDEHSRRLALFHVLDSLGGLVKHLKWAKLTSYQQNAALLDDLEAIMPEGVRAVLLPRAKRAVRALKQLQEGFFLESRLTPTGLRRPDTRDVENEVSLSTAASEWLQLIRNSQHGYDKTPNSRDRALLASHNGSIPTDLPDLAWLQLLRILAYPELLIRHPRR